MRLRTAVADRRTPHRALRPPDARIGYRSVGLCELLSGNAGQVRPEDLRRYEIESDVQVETQTQSRLVDLEEMSKPRDEEHDHSGITVRELHGPICLGTL